MFNVGETNKLHVKRKSDIGYILVNELDEEVLLHNNQVKGDINIGDLVEVFLYFDSEKRLTATMETPFIEVGMPGFVRVKDVIKNLGVFIFNNTTKDPLISTDDLPKDFSKWPHINDEVFCKLKYTKTQLIAKLVTPEELKDNVMPDIKLTKFQKVTAIVTKSGEEGVNLFTKEGHSIFVYYKHKRRDYHIGEEVIVTINNIKPDGTYNGTLLDNKLSLMKSDADIIIEYLNNNDGFMPYTIKSSVLYIENIFKMSKASFKRAFSNLYKKRLVNLKEDGTYLIK